MVETTQSYADMTRQRSEKRQLAGETESAASLMLTGVAEPTTKLCATSSSSTCLLVADAVALIAVAAAPAGKRRNRRIASTYSSMVDLTNQATHWQVQSAPFAWA